MKRHEIVTLARLQIAHASSYLERSIFANSFSDDDIDYSNAACECITALVALLTADDNLNMLDDDEIDTTLAFAEMSSTFAIDMGVCIELQNVLPDAD